MIQYYTYQVNNLKLNATMAKNAYKKRGQQIICSKNIVFMWQNID